MQMAMRFFLALSALLLAPASLYAQEQTACPAPAHPLEEPWSAWSSARTAVDAGKSAASAPALAIGTPVTLQLAPLSGVTLARPPEAKLDPARFDGLLSLDLAADSRVGIALSHAAWVDVLSGNEAQTSIDHDHGPDCSGIRKIVWFDLDAGRHVVQIVNSPAASVTIMSVVVTPTVD